MAEVGRTMGALVDAGYSQEDALDYATTKRQDGTISTDEWKALKYLNLN